MQLFCFFNWNVVWTKIFLRNVCLYEGWKYLSVTYLFRDFSKNTLLVISITKFRSSLKILCNFSIQYFFTMHTRSVWFQSNNVRVCRNFFFVQSLIRKNGKKTGSLLSKGFVYVWQTRSFLFLILYSFEYKVRLIKFAIQFVHRIISKTLFFLQIGNAPHSMTVYLTWLLIIFLRPWEIRHKRSWMTLWWFHLLSINIHFIEIRLCSLYVNVSRHLVVPKFTYNLKYTFRI